MTDSKQIESALAPHKESLRCILDFMADNANLELAGQAALIQLASSKSHESLSQAQHALTSLALLSTGTFRPASDDKIDYTAFTQEVCAGLWAICYLSNSPAAKTRCPELARKLRAAEFGFHVELAKALAKLF